ncbi:MAG: glycosyltransferase family 2 protein [Alishewanella agri]|nr:glycosyltransferase family 2 protein [Alishewanella agri]
MQPAKSPANPDLISNTIDAGYSIVAFAYNEERSIGATLASILKNTDSQLAHIAVIANGCTDRTADIAQAVLEQQAPCAFEVVNLELGDKCNAWNQYVYHYLPDCAVHFFVDSDVTFTKHAFPKLFQQLQASDRVAVTGLPQTGRNLAHYTELATRYSCMFGNLYGVKQEFLDRLKKQHIKLPAGLSWIDSQLTKLINHNLSADKSEYTHQVTFLEGAGFTFDSLKPWRRDDIKLYLNRITRYKVGQLQERYLDPLPFVDWPVTMNEINARILQQDLTLKNLGKMAIFLPKIKKRLQKKVQLKSEG